MLSISHIQLSVNQSLLILLFVPGLVSFCIVHSNAQVNMLQDNKNWSIMYESMFNSSIWTHHYTFEAGHEVNGVVYFRMLMSTDEAMTNWTGTSSYAREADNRIYYYTESDGEILAYDFNLMTGDTFFITHMGGEDFLVVESLDSIELYTGEYRKRWTLTQPDVQSPGANELIWIEGIGSPFGEILSPWLTVVITDQDGFLLCHQENEQMLFSYYEDATCHIFTNLKTTPRNDLPWSLHPNPATGFVNLHLLQQTSDTQIDFNTQNIEVAIYNALGQQVLKKNPDNSELNISHLTPGFYLVHFRTGSILSETQLLIIQ